jgi:L,D-transpeptidase YcbB
VAFWRPIRATYYTTNFARRAAEPAAKHSMRFRTLLVTLVLLLLRSPGQSVGQSSDVREQLRMRVEQLREENRLSIEGAAIAATRLIPEFYERRGFQPAWTEPRAVDELLQLISRMDSEGLDPEDYYVRAIQSLRARASRQKEDYRLQADLDVLLTESLIRLGYHLSFGKLDPHDLDPNWNFSRNLRGKDPAETLEAAIHAASLIRFVEDFAPQLKAYQRLKSALAAYREIAAKGGWPMVVGGETLKPGARATPVAVLRKRLQISGDLSQGTVQDLELYDNDLEQAVKRFQARHGLDPDGRVGRQTLEELNIPIGARIDQIRVNLERGRWLFGDIRAQDDFIIADIAGFRVYFFRANQVAWDSRAQVGRPYRKTPVFKAQMKYLVLNPTWTVPPTILARDILPKVAKNPAYLAERKLEVLDGNGKPVDPKSIDWSAYASRRFPYVLRQSPGRDNALGRIKFMFPNPHAVYLHDTPSKELFDRTERAFSSGCIRIDDPLRLAELLLDDQHQWNREAIERAIESGKTETVLLSKPVAVLLLYWTAEALEGGSVRFRKDIYGRDWQILQGLNSPFRFKVPTGMPEWYRTAP